MVDRNVDAGALANLTAKHVVMFPLVEMQLATGTLYVAGLPHQIDWNGHTWLADKGLGSIEPFTESSSEISGCAFTLSGIPSSTVSLVLTENVRGRPVIVRNATLSGAVLSVDDSAWTGQLDTLALQDNGETSIVRVTAESRLAYWQTPRPVNFSHAEQQLVDPTDTFYSRMTQMAEVTLVWPDKEFFKK